MHSYICGSCGSDWSMRYADTHKGAPCPLHAYTGLLLSGVRWHESHICAATRTFDKVVCTPSVCAVYSRFWSWFMLSQTLQRISRGRLHIGMHFRPLYMWLALAIIVVNCIVKNMLILFCGIHLLK